MKLPFNYSHEVRNSYIHLGLRDGPGWWRLLRVSQNKDIVELVMTATAYTELHFNNLQKELELREGRLLSEFCQILNSKEDWIEGNHPHFPPYNTWSTVEDSIYHDARYESMEIFPIRSEYVRDNFPAHWNASNCSVIAIINFRSPSLGISILKVSTEGFDI